VKSNDEQRMIKPHRIGGFRLLGLVPSLIMNPLETLTRLSLKYGHVITFDAGKYQRIHVVSEPDVVKHLLKTNAGNYLRSPVIRDLKPLLGNGIFIAEGQDWSEQHMLLKPALHEKHISDYMKIVTREVESMLGFINGGKLVDIEPQMEELMLNILMKTLFGITEGYDTHRIIQSHKAILRNAGIEKQKLAYFKRKIVGKRLGSRKPSTSELNYLYSVAEFIASTADKENAPLFRYMQNSSEEEVKDMILNLLFAGYDTTASALSWTLYCLAKHPEWQKKILDEGNEENTNSLKMVIQEAMRLFPPVWSIHRKSTNADCILGWDIDNNSFLMIDITSLHRNPTIWEKPEEFYPEHFSSENIKGKAFAYIPFGQGQRMCIGKPLANRELELIIPLILSQFELLLGSGQQKMKVKADIITKSKKGIKLEFTPRK